MSSGIVRRKSEVTDWNGDRLLREVARSRREQGLPIGDLTESMTKTWRAYERRWQSRLYRLDDLPRGLSADAPFPAHPRFDELSQRQLARAVMRLNPPLEDWELECLVARLNGWTIRATAAGVARSPGTVKYHVDRAVHRLAPLVHIGPYAELRDLLIEVFGWHTIVWVYG